MLLIHYRIAENIYRIRMELVQKHRLRQNIPLDAPPGTPLLPLQQYPKPVPPKEFFQQLITAARSPNSTQQQQKQVMSMVKNNLPWLYHTSQEHEEQYKHFWNLEI